MTRKGWSAYGAFDPDERAAGARPARLRQATRVLDVRADAVPRRRPRPALRRHPRPQPRHGRLLRRDDRLIAVGFVPLQDAGPSRRRGRRGASRSAAARSSCRRIPPRTHSPTHPDLDGVWARLQDAGVPLHVARRRRRPAAAAELPRERPAEADRLPRRRREHPVEGLHGPAQPARDLPRGDGARRRVREVPRPDVRRHRAGRAVGAGVAAAHRHRAGHVQEERAAARRPADAGIRLHPPPGAVHAVPDRAGRLADRTGRRGAVPVLVGLPAPGGHEGSARPLRGDARGHGRRRARSASTRRNFADLFALSA